jgi:hypothetical protein
MKNLTSILMLFLLLACSSKNSKPEKDILITQIDYFDKTTSLMDTSINNELSSLKNLAYKNPNKYKIYYDRATKITFASDSIIQGLDELSMNEYNLIKCIQDYLDYCSYLGCVSDTDFPSINNLNVFVNSGIISKYLNSRSNKALLIKQLTSMMKEVQFDILRYLIFYPRSLEGSYNTCIPIVVPNKTTLSVGEKFIATISLCTSDTTLLPKVSYSFDDEPSIEIVTDAFGFGVISKSFNTPGEKQLHGIYIFKPLGDRKLELPFITTIKVK